MWLHRVDVISQSIMSGHNNLYLYRSVCVCLCVYPSKHIYVAVCGPIGTKFGTHMQIHLEKVVGKIKIAPCDIGGTWGGGGFRGQKIKKMGEICQSAGPIGTKFGTHMRIHLGTNMG